MKNIFFKLLLFFCKKKGVIDSLKLLCYYDVCSLRSFCSLSYIKSYFFSLVKSFESVLLNLREVCEYILSIFTNKARVVGYFPPAAGNTPAAPQIPIKKSTHCSSWQRTAVDEVPIKRSRPVVCGNQTYPCGQVGALSPDSRFLIEPLGSSPQRGGLQSTGERRAPVE